VTIKNTAVSVDCGVDTVFAVFCVRFVWLSQQKIAASKKRENVQASVPYVFAPERIWVHL